MMYDVAVIGAGPAGSTTAAALAASGLRVCILEKDELPRHKLCGEFLSGDGAAVLRRLGLEECLLREGAVPVDRCVITSAGGASFESPLPGRPLSISRFTMDRALLNQALHLGAEVHMGTEVTEVTGTLEEGFEIRTRSDQGLGARVVMCAFGRSSALERRLGRSTDNPDSDPLVAFKAHHTGPFPDGCVELHGFDSGYCGIQKIEAGGVNVCWISRASVLRSAGGKPGNMVATLFEQNPFLARRLSDLHCVSDGYLAVSQLNLRPRTPVEGDLLMLGDSAGMIAPMCGDGMSMAISSGALAARLAEAYLRRQISSVSLKEQYGRRWRMSYRRRMWLGRMLHAGYERPPVSHFGIRFCQRFPAAGEWLIRATRG